MRKKKHYQSVYSVALALALILPFYAQADYSEGRIKDAITITDSFALSSVVYSERSDAKASLTAIIDGVAINNKSWIKASIGGKPVHILSVKNDGENTTVEMKYDYGKLPVGVYDLVITYKKQVLKEVEVGGEVKYKKAFEKGTFVEAGAFQVVAA